MKILFIVPAVPTMAGLNYIPTFPHLGIAYLAGMIRKNHEVKIIDLRLQTPLYFLRTIIRTYKPELIGITLTSFQHRIVYELIAGLRKAGDHNIVIGGPHVSALKKKALEDSCADLAVIGEGEYAIADICSGISYPDIDGLIWKNENGEIVENRAREYDNCLDSLPLPALDLFDLDKYVDKKIPVLSSRGCPYGCVFCSIGLSMGKRFRARTPENVVEEMEYWYRKGFRWFQFQDDCFSYDMDRARKICELIMRKNLKIKWELRNGLRVDRVDADLLRIMKNSGCTFVAYGIESADDGVLENIKKGASLVQALNAIRLTKEAGIDTGAFFIVGLPGDTPGKFKKSLNLAEELKLKEYWFYNAIPYPHTDLYRWVDKNARWIDYGKNYLEHFQYFDTKPAYETDDFPKNARMRALAYAQNKVMKRILKNEFGSVLGYVAYLIWRIHFANNIAARIGTKIWKIRRIRRLASALR